MDLNYLPSTSERAEILRESIFREGAISVSGVSKESKASKGLVSKYLSLLAAHGVLSKKGTKFFVKKGNRLKALRLLLTISELNEGLFRKYKFVESAGLYGSGAKGENTENSDIDLWIRVKEASQQELASLNSQIKRRFPKANLLMLTKGGIGQLKKDDPVFYYSLYFGSMIVYGETGV
ncbi:MAG: nucleotidyltransferase domain-containing protein [Candidatus Altiarchaeota archaeon]|nr:nucleotidyltransferase domain-containing protein [Candidatus Altiarchaeota archaeon]